MRKTAVLICAICVFLSSCSLFESKKNDISHYPFKESKKDKWGLIDANGKVLVENEFEEEPSVAVNGIFFAENKKGDWEIYSIDNPITPIGDRYKSILPFFNDVTPCVKKDEGIKYIDKSGNIKFELPLEYHTAYNFVNGYSVIVRKDRDKDENVRDAVSTDGQILKFKNYSILSILGDDTFVVSENEEMFYLVDHNGNIKTKLKGFTEFSRWPDDYTTTVFNPDQNYYVFAEEEGDIFRTGIRNIDGDIVIKPLDNRLYYFLENGQVMIVDDIDEERIYGIMDIEGNVLIKAKYSDLRLMGKDLYVVEKDEKYGLINAKEERLIPFEYVSMTPLSEKTVIARRKDTEDARTTLLDKDGNVLGEYASFDPNYYRFKIYSDYFEVSDMINAMLAPTSNGDFDDFYGFMGLAPGTCVEMMEESYTRSDIDDQNEWLPEKYKNVIDYGSVYYSLGFDEVVTTQTEYDSYEGYTNTYYTYSLSPCNKVKLKLYMFSDYDYRINFIMKQLPSAMEKCGFWKDSDYYDDYHYMNSSVKVEVEVEDEYFVITATAL